MHIGGVTWDKSEEIGRNQIIEGLAGHIKVFGFDIKWFGKLCLASCKKKSLNFNSSNSCAFFGYDFANSQKVESFPMVQIWRALRKL